jgi:predicted ATPase
MFKIEMYVGLNVSKFPVSYKQGESLVLKNPEAFNHPTTTVNMVASTIKKAIENDNSLIILSHCKFVLDLLGELIRLKKIEPNNVVIHVLDEQNNIEQDSGFDEDGYLVNWPVGFLSADFEEAENLFK